MVIDLMLATAVTPEADVASVAERLTTAAELGHRQARAIQGLAERGWRLESPEVITSDGYADICVRLTKRCDEQTAYADAAAAGATTSLNFSIGLQRAGEIEWWGELPGGD